MSGHPSFRVVELVDGDGVVRWVEATRTDEDAPWRLVWRYRQLVDTPLSCWLRTLPTPPFERTLLGNAMALDAPTARRLARFHRDELQAQGVPVLVEPEFRGRYGGRRTVVVGADGKVEVFRSLADAARHEGLGRPWLSTRHLRGLPGRGRQVM